MTKQSVNLSPWASCFQFSRCVLDFFLQPVSRNLIPEDSDSVLGSWNMYKGRLWGFVDNITWNTFMVELNHPEADRRSVFCCFTRCFFTHLDIQCADLIKKSCFLYHLYTAISPVVEWRNTNLMIDIQTHPLPGLFLHFMTFLFHSINIKV